MVRQVYNCPNKDHKIIAVATGDPEFNEYQEANQLPPHRLPMLRRFFQDYKQLEGLQAARRKAGGVDQIEPAARAYSVIDDALQRYQNWHRV